jgi:uncharacterized protein
MNKMPCELAVWESLPAIRAAIASEMVDSGLSQRVVADILGMAPSAVSQYLSGKRGYRIEFNREVRESIISLSVDLREGKVGDPGPRICSICTLIQGITDCGACEESEVQDPGKGTDNVRTDQGSRQTRTTRETSPV